MTASIRKPRVLRLAEGQKWACYYCKRKMQKGLGFSTTATVDHKTPLALGGSDGGANLCAACLRCNHVKGSMTAPEFFAAWGNMSRMPEHSPSRAVSPDEEKRRARKKQTNRIVASQGPKGKPTSKRLPKPPAQLAPCGLANLGDIADLRRALPVSVRLDMAWAALWAHCLETVDRRRAGR